jgi:uncharacterized protein YoaH (UPF0181 family)
MPLINRKEQRIRAEKVRGYMALGMQSDEIIEAMQREYKMNRSTVYNYIKKVKKNG